MKQEKRNSVALQKPKDVGGKMLAAFPALKKLKDHSDLLGQAPVP